MTIPYISDSPIIEACVDSAEGAVFAEQNGADRLELCSDLHLDGLTPTMDLLDSVLAAVDIPIKTMIRPRAGDFSYDLAERAQIRKDIEDCKARGITEFVYGSMQAGRLDIEDLKAVYEYAEPTSFTIHKAIDSSKSITSDVLELVKWVRQDPRVCLSILSSGGAATAEEGLLTLQRMLQLTRDHIELIVAGKVTTKNLDSLKRVIKAPAFHGRKIV